MTPLAHDFSTVQLLLAGLWGLVAGSALLVGAALGYFARVPQRVIAGVMAFGSGVLISALSFDLMEEAYERGGFDSTAAGFLGGAAIYTAVNCFLGRAGAKHRKRSGHHVPQPSEVEHKGSGSAIAFGALLDERDGSELPPPRAGVARSDSVLVTESVNAQRVAVSSTDWLDGLVTGAGKCDRLLGGGISSRASDSRR